MGQPRDDGVRSLRPAQGWAYLHPGGAGRLQPLPQHPSATSTLRTLRQMVTTEVLVGVGALTVAAALVNIAPPAEYAAAAARSQQAAFVVASGSDFATTVKVRLTVTPGIGGFNTFDLRVTDYDSGATIAADSVVLQFTPAIAAAAGNLDPRVEEAGRRHLRSERRQPLHRRHLGGGSDGSARAAVGRSASPADHRRPGTIGHRAAVLRRFANALHHPTRQGSISTGVHRSGQAGT